LPLIEQLCVHEQYQGIACTVAAGVVLSPCAQLQARYGVQQQLYAAAPLVVAGAATLHAVLSSSRRRAKACGCA
jgi:hypothetical protein